MAIYAFESYVLIWDTFEIPIWDKWLLLSSFYSGPVYFLLLLDKSNKIGHLNLQ